MVLKTRILAKKVKKCLKKKFQTKYEDMLKKIEMENGEDFDPDMKVSKLQLARLKMLVPIPL